MLSASSVFFIGAVRGLSKQEKFTDGTSALNQVSCFAEHAAQYPNQQQETELHDHKNNSSSRFKFQFQTVVS